METFTLELTAGEGQILYEYLKLYTWSGISAAPISKEENKNARLLRSKISKAMGQQLREVPKDRY